jgi:hypothetical protein
MFDTVVLAKIPNYSNFLVFSPANWDDLPSATKRFIERFQSRPEFASLSGGALWLGPAPVPVAQSWVNIQKQDDVIDCNN